MQSIKYPPYLFDVNTSKNYNVLNSETNVWAICNYIEYFLSTCSVQKITMEPSTSKGEKRKADVNDNELPKRQKSETRESSKTGESSGAFSG